MKVREYWINSSETAPLVALVLILMWLAGIVLAKGTWSVLFAICIPPYSWYLVVELVMFKFGFLGV